MIFSNFRSKRSHDDCMEYDQNLQETSTKANKNYVTYSRLNQTGRLNRPCRTHWTNRLNRPYRTNRFKRPCRSRWSCRKTCPRPAYAAFHSTQSQTIPAAAPNAAPVSITSDILNDIRLEEDGITITFLRTGLYHISYGIIATSAAGPDASIGIYESKHGTPAPAAAASIRPLLTGNREVNGTFMSTYSAGDTIFLGISSSNPSHCYQYDRKCGNAISPSTHWICTTNNSLFPRNDPTISLYL